MKKYASPPIERMMVLSTAHISHETAAKIAEADADPGATWAPTFTRDEGWVFYVAIDDCYKDAPHDLALLTRYAQQHGAHWLMLDCDGAVVDGLPTFEW